MEIALHSISVACMSCIPDDAVDRQNLGTLIYKYSILRRDKKLSYTQHLKLYYNLDVCLI